MGAHSARSSSPLATFWPSSPTRRARRGSPCGRATASMAPRTRRELRRVPRFGLPGRTYHLLSGHVTDVAHLRWPTPPRHWFRPRPVVAPGPTVVRRDRRRVLVQLHRREPSHDRRGHVPSARPVPERHTGRTTPHRKLTDGVRPCASLPAGSTVSTSATLDSWGSSGSGWPRQPSCSRRVAAKAGAGPARVGTGCGLDVEPPSSRGRSTWRRCRSSPTSRPTSVPRAAVEFDLEGEWLGSATFYEIERTDDSLVVLGAVPGSATGDEPYFDARFEVRDGAWRASGVGAGAGWRPIPARVSGPPSSASTRTTSPTQHRPPSRCWRPNAHAPAATSLVVARSNTWWSRPTRPSRSWSWSSPPPETRAARATRSFPGGDSNWPGRWAIRAILDAAFAPPTHLEWPLPAP